MARLYERAAHMTAPHPPRRMCRAPGHARQRAGAAAAVAWRTRPRNGPGVRACCPCGALHRRGEGIEQSSVWRPSRPTHPPREAGPRAAHRSMTRPPWVHRGQGARPVPLHPLHSAPAAAAPSSRARISVFCSQPAAQSALQPAGCGGTGGSGRAAAQPTPAGGAAARSRADAPPLHSRTARAAYASGARTGWSRRRLRPVEHTSVRLRRQERGGMRGGSPACTLARQKQTRQAGAHPPCASGSLGSGASCGAVRGREKGGG